MFKETLNPVLDRGEGNAPAPAVPEKLSMTGVYYLEPTANLVEVANLLRLTPTTCAPKWRVLECGCGRRVVKTGCMRSKCSVCAEQVRKRRAVSAFKRFHHPPRGTKHFYRSPVWCYTVFTLPEHIRYRYFDACEWQEIRRKAWHLLKTKFGASYALEGSHPIGDKSEKFAPHLNFIWMPMHGRDPYIDVAALRQAWAQVLGVQVADINHQYTHSHYKLMHWCLYVSKTYPEFAQWKGSIRWYGKYPVLPKRLQDVCPDCGQYVRAIGTIDDELVQFYDKHGFLMGRDPPWNNEDNINRFKSRKKKVDKKV